jgi:hypothetical protein
LPPAGRISGGKIGRESGGKIRREVRGKMGRISKGKIGRVGDESDVDSMEKGGDYGRPV